MGLEVIWYDTEQTILVATITQDTTWSDYHTAIDQIVKRAAAVRYRVDVVFVDNVGMPSGNPLIHLRSGINRLMQQPNIYCALVAGSNVSNSYFRSIFMMVGRIFGKGQKTPEIFTPTLEEQPLPDHSAQIAPNRRNP
ncbi:MAG: hypothetical protein U0694_22885 [Anaerolineae bacterium]